MIFKGYVTARSFNGIYMPVPAQNSCLREFCDQRQGQYVLPHLESSFKNCYHQLFGAVKESAPEDIILMYSIGMLPSGQKLADLLSLCREKQVAIAFVLENIIDSENFSKVFGELDSYRLKELELPFREWETLRSRVGFPEE